MKRLLVAEDEKLLGENLQALFREHGFEVEVAPDGAQAIRRIEGERFDLVITDVRLPEADGMEVLRKARQADESTMVLVMTAYG